MLRGAGNRRQRARRDQVQEPAVRQAEGSFLERILLADLNKAGLKGFEREVRFHPRRKWQFDFAWRHERIAVEVEGGTMRGGRHVRGEGFEKDCVKYNTATIMGWRVLRFTSRQVRQNQCVPIIIEALGGIDARQEAHYKEVDDTFKASYPRLQPFQELFIVKCLGKEQGHRAIEWWNGLEEEAHASPEGGRPEGGRQALPEGQAQEDSRSEGLSGEGEGPASGDLQGKVQGQQRRARRQDGQAGG